jgi:putative glutamine amidotransferase
MNKKPVIGITGAYVKHTAHMEGLYVHHDYHKTVAATGGLPIILPYINPEIAIEMLPLCDGIILSGGEDVDPIFYGSEPHQHIGPTIKQRDAVEIAITKYAIEHRIPVLAICRGMQILNVALGGTLMQDIPSQVKEPLQHSQLIERGQDCHWVTIEKESKLYQVLGEERVRVNSLHHQAINTVANELKVVAKASDGIVEAVEYIGSSFVIGVQWHPESMASWDPIMKKLFLEFIQQCKK